MNEHSIRSEIAGMGLALEIKNHREHWIFTGHNFLAEWWPSTGRLVFNKKWNRAVIERDDRRIVGRIWNRLPVVRYVYAGIPAYLNRVKELVES